MAARNLIFLLLYKTKAKVDFGHLSAPDMAKVQLNEALVLHGKYKTIKEKKNNLHSWSISRSS